MLTTKTFRYDVRRDVQAVRCDRCELTAPFFYRFGPGTDAQFLASQGVPPEQLRPPADWLHVETGKVRLDFCGKCAPLALEALEKVAAARIGGVA